MASLDSLRLSILPISRSRDDTPAADMELHHIDQNTVQKSLSSLSSRRKHPDSNTRVGGEQSGDVPNDLPPPSTAVQVLQSWNQPRSNKWKVFATLFGFIIFGLNDSVWMP
jgi:hypothetical protein